MANKILVGETWHKIDDDYRFGALHARIGLVKSGYEANQTPSWLAGYRNERNRQHVRFGVDVINAKDTRKRFSVDHALKKNNSTWYVAYLEATGALGYVRSIVGSDYGRPEWRNSNDRVPAGSPGVLRQNLKTEGIEISTADCELALRRVHFENIRRGFSLSAEEREAVSSLSGPRRALLVHMAEYTDANWCDSITSQDISWQAKRSSSWAAATALKMEREGLGFLFDFRGNGYTSITGKGWSGYDLIKSYEAETDINNESRASPDM